MSLTPAARKLEHALAEYVASLDDMEDCVLVDWFVGVAIARPAPNESGAFATTYHYATSDSTGHAVLGVATLTSSYLAHDLGAPS